MGDGCGDGNSSNGGRNFCDGDGCDDGDEGVGNGVNWDLRGDGEVVMSDSLVVMVVK